MSHKGRKRSLNYTQPTEFYASPQGLSRWSCPDTKVSIELRKLSITQTLTASQVMPKLSLKPRLSMKKLAAMDEMCTDKVRQCGNFIRSSTTFEEKEGTSTVYDLPKPKWSSTEDALDVLAAHTKPRRSRMSFCVGSTIGQQPATPEKLKEPKMFELIPWQDPPKKEVKSSSPTCFINLPQLPFGRHRSYNDVKDIRGLIVSRKEKAWRRRKVTKAVSDELDI